jgi:hypothetical protein
VHIHIITYAHTYKYEASNYLYVIDPFLQLIFLLTQIYYYFMQKQIFTQLTHTDYIVKHFCIIHICLDFL